VPVSCRNKHTRVAMLLFGMVFPVSLIFLGVVGGLHLGHGSITPMLLAGYNFAAMAQASLDAARFL